MFITGKAGTGKSTLLQHFRETTGRRAVVLAPTGVAAVNIRGQTIHSFFRFKPDITPDKARAIGQRVARNEPRAIYRSLDTIVLDEISMVRADLFECIDNFLRAIRRKPSLPFGGVRMILIGDLYQLPPIVTAPERTAFATRYRGPYFFDHPLFARLDIEFVELEKVYRQRDPGFIALLNAVRNNTLTEAMLRTLNHRHHPTGPTDDAGYITLTAMNEPAARLNAAKLGALRGRPETLVGEVRGDFRADALPTEQRLTLKIGARVMLLNNDSEGRWVNGTVGTVMAIPRQKTYLTVALESGDHVEVAPYTWDLLHYAVDPHTRILTTKSIGQFTQFPLKLAWAVTIHKSQGKTFDRVIIDIGRGTFATGQMYVALSRCRSLDGIVLRQRLQSRHIRVDYRIIKFLTQYQYQRSDARLPLDDKVRMIQAAIDHHHLLTITYLKNQDVKSRRIIQPAEVGTMEYAGRPFVGVRGYCHARKEERVFRVDRILDLQVAQGT